MNLAFALHGAWINIPHLSYLGQVTVILGVYYQKNDLTVSEPLSTFKKSPLRMGVVDFFGKPHS